MNSILITRKIEDKTIVWFKESNNYVVLENTTASILEDISNAVSKENITKRITKELKIPYNKVFDFVLDIEQKLYFRNIKKEKIDISKFNKSLIPSSFEYLKYYKINNFIFKVAYKNEDNLSFVHPKFAHLEIDSIIEVDFYYQVFTEKNYTHLIVDNTHIGSWQKEDIHYFQGKFSMQIVQDMHQKEEDKWLGVFHASAISNGENSMLFLGDSGNGKSTSLALLQASKFTCLADDFVPLDAKDKEIYSFPSAISIKKNSLETLLPIYPELKNSAEYHFKRLNKTVRYLPPNNTDYTEHLPCKALVFIKYKKESDITIYRILSIDAFEKLVPDSWVSPIQENAVSFLDWFVDLPCYELIYSDNQKMIATVSKIFNDEL